MTYHATVHATPELLPRIHEERLEIVLNFHGFFFPKNLPKIPLKFWNKGLENLKGRFQEV